MPPSQLKRLKASLREQGITGPQKSKKQKKSQNKNADHRAQRASAIAAIRESSNPFDFKHLSRPKKFDYVSNQPENAAKKILGRPGVTKSQGEETRRKTLLPEMNRKNKVGGILDRRIGENDPTMSLEDRRMARFERQQQQQRKSSGNVFDLEDGDDEVMLTHGGQSLKFDDEIGEEDYDAASVSGSSDGEDGFLKRKRGGDDVDGEENGEAPTEEQPERKKSKAEVMKEVIAKSKLHKYERQAQKEDDDDLIQELDKDLNSVLAALRGHINQKPEAEAPREAPNNDFGMHADRAALLTGSSQQAKDKEYDLRVRQMLQDERAKPTERTKTEEEKAREDAKRLRELEEKRMKRMKGEPISDDEEPTKKKNDNEDEGEDDDADSDHGDAAEFGLGAAQSQFSRPEGVEDEDDFLMDDDLIATDSEADISENESDEESTADDTMAMDEDDADFLKSVLPEREAQPKAVDGVLTLGPNITSSKLAFTYACPRSHEELLDVFKKVEPNDISVVIQRIRALYHAGLHADNKHKLADFACALIDHVSYLSNQTPAVSLAVIEAMNRHIHSMSRSYPVQIATRFREHLKLLFASNSPTPGDLALLTAIGSIYPTSDHFHQVVTPAITLMARWMGLTTPASAHDIAIGAFIGALCLQYQRLSKRYIPELIRYTILCLNSPHTTPTLLTAHTKNILVAADLWSASPAVIETFTPLLAPLKSTNQTPTLQNLQARLSLSRSKRRPQLLHHHRPLPIKSSIPKFEESFDPNKHYDPDKERAEAIRLQKEYRRERKGALRELRKDANFVARERLRDKKEKDKAYEAKYKRLVAEIQGEEGREAKAYEREKRGRRRG